MFLPRVRHFVIRSETPFAKNSKRWTGGQITGLDRGCGGVTYRHPLGKHILHHELSQIRHFLPSHDTMSEQHDTITARPNDEAIASNEPADDVDYEKRNAHNTVGLAVMQQQELIPTTGERKPTTKWEVRNCI